MATRLLTRDETRSFYDRMGRWLDLQKPFEDPAFDALIAQGDFGDARAVVELGCGTGRFARRLLANELPSDATYVGFDLSPRMREIASRRLSSWSDRASVRAAPNGGTKDGRELPLEAGCCDRFVCTFVLDLMSEDEIAARLREARRLLSPGGRLCLASLTDGRTPMSRLFSRLWARVHAWNPRIVGGCRPLRLSDHVPPEWEILYNDAHCSFGFCSDVLVAVVRVADAPAEPTPQRDPGDLDP